MNSLSQVLRIRVLALLLICIVCGCNSKPESTAKRSSNTDGIQLDSVTLMLNWYPEAEHGGFYAAQVGGIFEKYGLDVVIRPGGPNAPVAQELVTGRVEFAIGNADDVLLFRQQDIDVIALMAPIQNTPRCVLVRNDSGVSDLNSLKGMTLQANVGRPFLTFMEKQGLLEGVNVVPYQGSVVQLVSDPQTAIQAYSFSEPLTAEQQGVEVELLMLSDIGFNPYASCLMTTDEYASENRDIVSRMVIACREGWKEYLETPDASNEVILQQNEFGLTKESLDFGVDALRPLCVPEGMAPTEVGQMSKDRWDQLVEQFAGLGLVTADKVKAEEVFTSEFLERDSNGL